MGKTIFSLKAKSICLIDFQRQKVTITKCGHNPWLHNYNEFESIIRQHYNENQT